MGFLYFIEEHHAVWFASYSLGQLSALVVADISRRCTDESAHAELLLIFAHVDTRHHGLVVEQIFGKCLCQLRLSDTRRTEEYERSDRSFRVLQSRAASSHGIAYGCDSLLLTDYTLVKLLLKMQQLLSFALHHTCYRDTRPAANHLSYVVGSHLLAYHRLTSLSSA